MFWSVVLALLFLLFPALAMFGERRSKVLAWLSPVVLCYALGILLANFRLIPIDDGLAGGFASATVILAIPMLLFSMDFRRWLRLAPQLGVYRPRRQRQAGLVSKPVARS